MPETTTLEIYPDFPRWYTAVGGLEDDRDRVHRRYSGLAALMKELTWNDVEAMIRVIFRARQKASPEALAHLRGFFKKSDDLFDMNGNDRELEVLCGATLAILFTKESTLAASAALAVTTTCMEGARSADLPMDLRMLAERAIVKIAETVRSRPDLSLRTAEAPVRLDLTTAKTKLQQQQDWNGVVAAFDLVAEAVDAALLRSAKQSTTAIQKANKFIAIQDEELEALWWAFGERSETLGLPFKKIPAMRQVLVLAKELADATRFLPGLPSGKALLARAGLKNGTNKVTIPAAVNACDVEWLRSLSIQSNISPVSAPLHSAIFRKLETGDEASWISGWAAVSGINQNHSLSALTLGHLFYRERLLALLPQG